MSKFIDIELTDGEEIWLNIANIIFIGKGEMENTHNTEIFTKGDISLHTRERTEELIQRIHNV